MHYLSFCLPVDAQTVDEVSVLSVCYAVLCS